MQFSKQAMLACGLAGSLFLAGCAKEPPPAPPPPSQAAAQPGLGTLDGSVSMALTGVALGVGYEWGKGTLNYQGRQYPFSVRGLSIVDIGVSNVTATGEVYNLPSVNLFEGNYAEFQAEATVAGGASFASMKNQNGVVIRITSTTTGLRLSLAPGGVQIRMGH